MAAVIPASHAMPAPNQRMTRIAKSIGQHLRKVGPTRILLRIVVIGFVALVISGIGHALLQPARNEPNEAARLVGSLTEERATLASVPTSFDSNLGYQPVAVAGNLVNPNGGCSTPGRIGPESFDTACRTHDLGYDVLRFAEAEGDRLGAGARFNLDLLLYADMLETCETVKCQATATAYYTAVTANSIRQGYKAPTEEPTVPWLGVGLIVLGLALILPVGSLGGAATKKRPGIQFFQPKVRGYSKVPGREPVSAAADACHSSHPLETGTPPDFSFPPTLSQCSQPYARAWAVDSLPKSKAEYRAQCMRQPRLDF